MTPKISANVLEPCENTAQTDDAIGKKIERKEDARGKASEGNQATEDIQTVRFIECNSISKPTQCNSLRDFISDSEYGNC